MTLRGMFTGLLGLTLLQAVLSSNQSAERTAGIWSALTSGVARFMSPTVAAIPDLRERKNYDDVAPGDPGRIPYDPSSAAAGTSKTMPATWTTKPAAPKAI